MTDIFAPKRRSQIMSAIRPRGNKSTELKLAGLFREIGIRGWRRHASLIGRPDFIFPRSRVAIFVDGDFWHGHPTRFKPPKSNTIFWTEKIDYNRRRDRHVSAELRRKKWIVIRIWEGDLRRSPLRALRRIVSKL